MYQYKDTVLYYLTHFTFTTFSKSFSAWFGGLSVSQLGQLLCTKDAPK